MQRILEWDEVTPEVIRIWAYDDDLLLLEQDEDLLLYGVEFIPVLLELSGDDRCPKEVYAFSILCQFSREQVTRGGESGTAQLRAAWSLIAEPLGGRPLEWYRYVARLLAYSCRSGPVDKRHARCMAKELLLGISGRVGRVVENDQIRPGWWRFSLQTSVTEHVDVCASSGEFVYTPWY